VRFKILVGAPLFFPLDGQTKGGVVVGTTPSSRSLKTKGIKDPIFSFTSKGISFFRKTYLCGLISIPVVVQNKFRRSL
jgi:hypothetical protein